jgi:hypothetical protein
MNQVYNKLFIVDCLVLFEAPQAHDFPHQFSFWVKGSILHWQTKHTGETREDQGLEFQNLTHDQS